MNSLLCTTLLISCFLTCCWLALESWHFRLEWGPQPLFPSNTCMKWDSPILFSLILSWQPCNTALLHNWIATLDTVSFNSPAKKKKKKRPRETEILVCFVYRGAVEKGAAKIRFHTNGWMIMRYFLCEWEMRNKRMLGEKKHYSRKKASLLVTGFHLVCKC